ncbi:hypothetical protein [Streptomyces sp. NPDC051776]|uniref:hypothetical protein n=1 Tax=Streptomyces sp. NPDC051776 TaxID=3155414 RepID=UPI003445F9C3
MTNFIVSIPGTFTEPLGADAKSRLLTALQGADPEEVGAVPPQLDVLSVDDSNGTFILRLEVDAEDSEAACLEVLSIAGEALKAAGYDERTASLGDPFLTAIDTE